MRTILSSHGRKGWLGYTGIPLFLMIWSGLAYSKLVDPLILPPPDRVILAAQDIGDTLISHFCASLARVLVGFIASALIGTAVGVAMQFNKPMYAILDGMIETARPVPPVALVPFFILIFGFSEVGRFLLVFLATTLVIIVTVVEALDRVLPVLIQLGLVSGLSRSQVFRLILIPAAIPYAKAGFRIALALAMTLVVVSEFLGSQYGLGYLINVAKVTLTTSTIILCVMLLGLIGFTLDLLVRGIFAYFSRWELSSREAVR